MTRQVATTALAVLTLVFAARADAQTATNRLEPRVFAGLWTADGTGVLLGGGLAAHPFRERKHEIQGNLAYQHVEDSDGLGIDVDYLYHFLNTRAGKFHPYAGGGIKIDAFEHSDANLQLGGGLRRGLSRGRSFFGELWFVLGDYDPIILRAGLSW